MKAKQVKTFLPVFPGFYYTIFEPQEYNEMDYINELRTEKGLTEAPWEAFKFDYSDYRERVAKGCVNFIEDRLNEVFENKITIVYEVISSPREYNFHTDAIHITIKATQKFRRELTKYLKANYEAFRLYIKDNYTSRDGFMSFYSNYAHDWIADMPNRMDTNAHILGALLEFVCQNEDINHDDMYMDICGDTYIQCSNYSELVPD